jgi:hypothetical protein
MLAGILPIELRPTPPNTSLRRGLSSSGALSVTAERTCLYPHQFRLSSPGRLHSLLAHFDSPSLSLFLTFSRGARRSKFDVPTHEAVRVWQRKHALPPTGYFGELSRKVRVVGRRHSTRQCGRQSGPLSTRRQMICASPRATGSLFWSSVHVVLPNVALTIRTLLLRRKSQRWPRRLRPRPPRWTLRRPQYRW